MRTGRIIHLLQGKWTQALKQFRGRRVSKCDHFVTCQEERAGPSRGGHKGVGLSDVTVSVHPFRLGEDEGGRGRIQLKPQGCYHPSEKETHPEARKDCEHLVKISTRRCEVRRVGSLLNWGLHGPTYLLQWESPSRVLCLDRQLNFFFFFGRFPY